MQGVTIVPHTADLQLHIQASSMNELFRHALVGMFESSGPAFELFSPCSHQFDIHAQDKEQLLVDLLSHALYLSDVNNEAYTALDIDILNDHHIKGTLHGAKVKSFSTEIKAVTYHKLVIKQLDGRWQTDIVFDI